MFRRGSINSTHEIICPSSYPAVAVRTAYFFLFGLCVSAEPEAVFAGLLESAFRKTLDAAVAAELEVTFAGACLCESAEPAADFAALLAFGFCKTFDAAVAARFPVVSLFFAIALYLRFLVVFL